jgi:hypothetical protein
MQITIEAVKEFLAAAPDTEYEFFDFEHCVMAQFLKAQGYSNVTAAGFSVRGNLPNGPMDYITVPGVIAYAACYGSLPMTRTFGGMLAALDDPRIMGMGADHDNYRP